MFYTFGEGVFIIQITRPDDTDSGAAIFDGTNLKVVAIPPSEADGVTQGITYEELSSRFDLD